MSKRYCTCKRQETCGKCSPAARVARYRAKTRQFGVELEFEGEPLDVLSSCERLGLKVYRQMYNHDTNWHNWKIVPDASLACGAELVSPPLRSLRPVERAISALRLADADTPRSTGLHVHYDVRDLAPTVLACLVSTWYYSQKAINRLVTRDRRGHGNYQRPFYNEDYDVLSRLLSRWNRVYAPNWYGQNRPRYLDSTQREAYFARSDIGNYPRYYNLNLSCIPSGTIEIRQHKGTLNVHKALTWIQFGRALLKTSELGVIINTSSTYNLIKQLCVFGELPYDVALYLWGWALWYGNKYDEEVF